MSEGLKALKRLNCNVKRSSCEYNISDYVEIIEKELKKSESIEKTIKYKITFLKKEIDEKQEEQKNAWTELRDSLEEDILYLTGQLDICEELLNQMEMLKDE